MPTLDTSGHANWTGTGGSQTIASFTVGANSDRILVVCIASGSTIATPAWNGSAMTAIYTGSFASSPSVNYGLYYIIAPSTGAQNLTGTYTNSGVYTLAYYSFYNCSQSNDPDNTVQGTSGSGTSSSLNITPNSDSDLAIFFNLAYISATLAGDASANQVTTTTINAGISAGTSGVTSPVVTLTGTMTQTIGPYLMLAVALKAKTQTSALSLTMGNAASHTQTSSRAVENTRTGSLSMMNAASRTATVAFNYWFTRTLSVTAMTFSTLISSVGGIWTRLTKSSTTFSEASKSSTSWDNPSKSSDSWTYPSKSTL